MATVTYADAIPASVVPWVHSFSERAITFTTALFLLLISLHPLYLLDSYDTTKPDDAYPNIADNLIISVADKLYHPVLMLIAIHVRLPWMFPALPLKPDHPLSRSTARPEPALRPSFIKQFLVK